MLLRARLCALLFRPHNSDHGQPSPLMRPVHAFFDAFDAGFDALARSYAEVVRRLARAWLPVLVGYVALMAFAGWFVFRLPTGFIPSLDRAILIISLQLPPGASLARTDAVIRKATDIIMTTPGVAHSVAFSGFDGATFTNASNSGAIFSAFQPFATRDPKGETADEILAQLRQKLAGIQDGFIVTVEPAPVPGIGDAGGFKMEIEDRQNQGYGALNGAVHAMVAAASTLGPAVFRSANARKKCSLFLAAAQMAASPIQRSRLSKGLLSAFSTASPAAEDAG